MTIKVTKDFTIGQVLMLDGRTAELLMGFGMHCLGCPMSNNESIEQACMTHGFEVEELVEKLNDFFEENTV